MAGNERLLQNEIKQLWKSHVQTGIMGNQTLEYVSDRLLKVLDFGLFIILLKNNGNNVSQCWGVCDGNDPGEINLENLLQI